MEPPEWLLSEVPLGPVYAVTNPAWTEGPIQAYSVWGPNMAVRQSVFSAGHRFDERIGPDGTTTYAMGSETEFTMRLEDYRLMGGHVRNIVPVEQVLADQRKKAVAPHAENPWPMDLPGGGR